MQGCLFFFPAIMTCGFYQMSWKSMTRVMLSSSAYGIFIPGKYRSYPLTLQGKLESTFSCVPNGKLPRGSFRCNQGHNPKAFKFYQPSFSGMRPHLSLAPPAPGSPSSRLPAHIPWRPNLGSQRSSLGKYLSHEHQGQLWCLFPPRRTEVRISV